MHQLSCILSYFFCICLALHAINYANHNVNAKTIINSWLEGAVYEGADNVKQVTTFKEMIWNSLTMLRLTSNHTVKTLYYHPDWNSAYVYNHETAECVKIKTFGNQLQKSFWPFIELGEFRNQTVAGFFMFIKNTLKNLKNNLSHKEDIQTQKDGIVSYKKQLQNSDGSLFEIISSMHDDQNNKFVSIKSTKSGATPYTRVFCFYNPENETKTEIHLAVNNGYTPRYVFYKMPWQIPLKVITNIKEQIEKPLALDHDLFQVDFFLWTKDGVQRRYRITVDFEHKLYSLIDHEAQKRTIFCEKFHFVREISLDNNECKLSNDVHFDIKMKLFRQRFAFVFEYQKLGQYFLTGRHQIRHLMTNQKSRIEQVNEENIQVWQVYMKTNTESVTSVDQLLAWRKLVLNKSATVSPLLSTNIEIFAQRSIKLRSDSIYLEAFEMNDCLNPKLNTFFVESKFSSNIDSGKLSEYVAKNGEEFKRLFVNALAQQAETYTFSFAIIDIRPQLNHLNVVYRFNRILSPEVFYQQIAGPHLTKLRETNWSFNDLFEKCIRNGVETWSDLYIYQFYGSCRSVYGANMTETLIEEIEYTNNFTSSALIKSCLNKGYKFPLIQDWINRLTSSSSLIDFKSEDGSRFELKFSALQQSATNEQRPFHLKLSNYDLASSVVWGRSEQSASQLKIWTPFDCYRQCLTVSNNAIFEKSKQTCSAFSFCTRQDRGAGKWQSTCKFSQTLVDKDETIDESFRSESVLAQDHCQLYQLDPLSQFKCPHTNRLLHEKSRQHQMSERIVNSVTDCAVACLSIAGCGSFTLIANETSREQRCTLLSANLIHFTDNDFEAKTFYNRKSIVCTFYTKNLLHQFHRIPLMMVQNAVVSVLKETLETSRINCAANCYQTAACQRFNYCYDGLKHLCVLELPNYSNTSESLFTEQHYATFNCESYQRHRSDLISEFTSNSTLTVNAEERPESAELPVVSFWIASWCFAATFVISLSSVLIAQCFRCKQKMPLGVTQPSNSAVTVMFRSEAKV